VGPISASMHSIREMPCGNRHGPKSRGSMIFGVLSMYYYSHERGICGQQNLFSKKVGSRMDGVLMVVYVFLREEGLALMRFCIEHGKAEVV
jgi:hypothetical protein